MKTIVKVLAATLALSGTALAQAREINVGVSIAGEFQPGVYGQVNVNTMPTYAVPSYVTYPQQTVIVQQPAYYAVPVRPVYVVQPYYQDYRQDYRRCYHGRGRGHGHHHH
jgi:hypothetical protein